MKLTMIMVMTADGIIAKNADHNAFTWTSSEDKAHFLAKSKEIGVVMMGGSTFKASGRKSYSDRIGIVLTNHPENYEAGENIYFKAGKPEEIYKELQADGYKHVALIGGARTNADFLQAGLVDDVYLTIEPKMFGKGLHIADDFDLDLDLKLLDFEKLNEEGTLLLHYQFIKK